MAAESRARQHERALCVTFFKSEEGVEGLLRRCFQVRSHERPYWEVFPPEDLIVLSPDAEEVGCMYQAWFAYYYLHTSVRVEVCVALFPVLCHSHVDLKEPSTYLCRGFVQTGQVCYQCVYIHCVEPCLASW